MESPLYRLRFNLSWGRQGSWGRHTEGVKNINAINQKLWLVARKCERLLVLDQSMGGLSYSPLPNPKYSAYRIVDKVEDKIMKLTYDSAD